MRLVLATKNEGKLKELRKLLQGLDYDVVSLADFPEIPEIVEDGDTFLSNARKKARTVCIATGFLALADDSGLVVDELNGEPGVISARYAGVQCDYAANNEKLLRKMSFVPCGRRGAAFVCTMVLASPDGREWDVEGRCEGEIAYEPKGHGGFGYDPLFFIPGEGRTMAELSMDKKNELSHRGKALRKIREILKNCLSG